MSTDNRKTIPEAGDTAAAGIPFRRTVPFEGIGAASEPAEPHRTSGSLPGLGKSIRLNARTPRGGLAGRLAVPIIVALLVGFLVISLILRNHVFNLQVKSIKSNAANGSFITAMLGRLLIVHRDKFIADHPEYLQKAEWKAGEHWLVEHGFINKKDWVAATGFELDEYTPASIIEKAVEKTFLLDLDRYINTAEAETDIIAVYLLNANGTPLAVSQKTGFRFDPLALKAIPLPSACIEVGGCRITVDYLPDFQPEPVVRGVARILSYDDPNQIIGSAVVVLRTLRHTQEQTAFLFLLMGLALLLSVFMSLVCWYSARNVTIPMRRMAADMRAMAEGDFTRRAEGHDGTTEMSMLAEAFNSMAERLRVARANEQENCRLENDLAIARNIQNNLLPPQTPRVRGLDIHTSYRPAKEIGGDYFDFLPVDDRHMGIVVADASGKSIPAALVMSTTRAILRFVAPGGLSAAETLANVNSILSVDIPKGMFVSAYYIILSPLAGTMLCASAGHTPLLIARADDSVEILNPGGIALGFDSGPIFQRSIREQRVKLGSGDRVLLYTDGVVECANAANEEYSERRLREFLRRNRTLTSHDFVGALLADLDRHRGTADMRDDTTIVTFRIL